MEYNEIFTGTVKEFQSKFKEIPEGYDGTEDPGYLNYIFEDSEEAELLRNEFSSLAGGEPIETIKPDPDELKNSESEILSVGRDMISTMSGEISRKLDILEGKYQRSGFSLADLDNFIKDSRDSIGKLAYNDLGGIKDSKNKLDSVEAGLVVNEKVLEEEGAKTPPVPAAPTPDPNAPTPDPNAPTPDPNAPTPDPNAPTPDPNAPTPDPNAPTPDPNAPTPPSPKTVPIRILGENEFKVMTYNVEFDDKNQDRFNSIAEVINFENPDILAIQEGGWIYGFDRIVLNGYQNGEDVIASNNPNSKSILYYNKDKFEKIGGATESRPRGISGMRLRHKNTGKIFCAVSFHLDHYASNTNFKGTNNRNKTKILFENFLKDLQYRPGDHVILMGDSNEFYQDILGKDRVKDMGSSPDPFKITTGGYQIDINFKDGEDKSCCVPVVAQRTNIGTGFYAYRADIIGSDLESFDVELSKKELEMAKSNVVSDHRPVIGYFKVKDDKPGEYEFFEYNGGRSDRENKSRFGFRKTGESQLYECRVDVSDQSLKDFFMTLMNMRGVTVAIVTYNYRFAIQGFLDYLFSNNSSVADQIKISVPEDVGDRGDVLNSGTKNPQLEKLKTENGIQTNSQIVLVDDSPDNIKSACDGKFWGIEVSICRELQ
jgi:hypothetical protein